MVGNYVLGDVGNAFWVARKAMKCCTHPGSVAENFRKKF
jgi:hypothetical protein